MIYTLIFWIAGCVGLACPVPDYEIRYYDDLERCESHLRAWKLSNKENEGICLKGKRVIDNA